MSKSQSAKPIEIKISTVVAVSAILHATALAVLEAAMQEITGGESDYFEGEFAVIDVGALDPADGGIDWDALIRLFKSHHLNPVAVRNAAPGMEAAILARGLSLDVIAKPRHEAAAPAPAVTAAVPVAPVAPVTPPAPEPAAPAICGSMIVDTPVRAGQRIYARGADLIVMAAVNNGAEVIADGSIHVYAPLRGRALAGASGNSDARIFALCMEPELVSIAGVYRTFEGGFPQEYANQPTQVRLVGDRIDVKAISPVAR